MKTFSVAAKISGYADIVINSKDREDALFQVKELLDSGPLVSTNNKLIDSIDIAQYEIFEVEEINISL